MNAFPYTNPYTQQGPSSTLGAATTAATESHHHGNHHHKQHHHQQHHRNDLDSLLQQLVVSSSAPKETIQQLKQYIQQQQQERRPEAWSWTSITQLVEWTLQTVKMTWKNDNNKNHRKRRADATAASEETNATASTAAEALALLARAAEHCWSDAQVYAASIYVPDEEKGSSSLNLLQVVQNLVVSQDCTTKDNNSNNNKICRTLQSCALIVLTTLWRSLDRLDRVTSRSPTSSSTTSSSSSSAAWWMEIDDDKKVLVNNTSSIRNSCDDSFATTTSASTAPSSSLTTASKIALQVILQHDSEDSSSSLYKMYDSSIVQTEEVQIACVSLLIQLVQDDQKRHPQARSSDNWLLATSTESIQELANRLKIQVDRLKDPNMPLSSYTHLSLASLQLLLLVQSYCTTTSSSNNNRSSSSSSSSHHPHLAQTLQHVVRAAFNTNSPSGPRWTQNSDISGLLNKWTMPVLYAWLETDAHAANKTLALMGHVSEQTWSRLLSTAATGRVDSTIDSNDLTLSRQTWHILVFMHFHCRMTSREGLSNVLSIPRSNNNGSSSSSSSLPSPLSNLLRLLVDCIRQKESLEAAVLLRTLLEDRRSSVTHDELSRDIWQSLNSRFVVECLELAASLKSSPSPSSHPRLLCLLDILHLLMSLEPTICESVLSSLSAQSIESLIHIMSPKEVRIVLDHGNTTNAMDTSMGLDSVDSSTPPANNLSRLEEKSILSSSIHEMEDVKPIGMESTVRIATATVLAVLGEFRGNASADGVASRVILLQNRMMNAVHSFVGDLQLSISSQSSNSVHSRDITQRRLRLLSYLATPENEDYLATLLYSAEISQRRCVHTLEQEVLRHKQAINESQQREKQLFAEKESCLEKLTSQAVMFQRQKSEFQRSTVQNAKSLVQVHHAERSKSDHRAQELSDHMRDMEKRLAETERATESSRRAELKATAALEEMKDKVDALASSEQEAVRREQECSRKLGQVVEELRSVNSRQGQMKRNEEKMLAQISIQKESIASMDESQLAMRDSLESLFADMVSLAQAYEQMERDGKSKLEHSEITKQKLKQKLEAERARCADLEEKFRQTECENDMLSRKYAKAREKLEKEREGRQREAIDRRRRAGPVSYINQLHHSTASERHFKDNSKSNEFKENDSNNSSSTSFRASHKNRQHR